MHIDWSISIGVIIQVVAMIGSLVVILVRLARHMGIVEARLATLTERLDRIDTRVERTETILFNFAQKLQRVMGHLAIYDHNLED